MTDFEFRRYYYCSYKFIGGSGVDVYHDDPNWLDKWLEEVDGFDRTVHERMSNTGGTLTIVSSVII
jgi:hypothetical protein